MADIDNVIAIFGILIVPPLLAWLIKNLWVAATSSAIIVTILLHIPSWLITGYMDPFDRISIPISAVVFFGWSAAIAWLVGRSRQNQVTNQDQNSSSEESG